MKKIWRDPYFLGIFYSLLSMAVTLSINVLLYPIYWKILSKPDFVTWFSVFELSQFFLLLDIGFSQNFIKNNATGNSDSIEKNYHRLRGTLLLVALFALLIQLPTFFFTTETDSLQNFFPYFLLALSTALTLWSYAETAALRVFLSFQTIYIINIASSLVFLGIVLFFKEYGIYAIAIGSFIRAVLQNVAQTLALSFRLRITMKLVMVFESTMSAFFMNSAYLLLFAFDAIIFSKIGIKPDAVSSYMMNRKLYDILRGVFDVAMNIVAVRLANKRSARLTIGSSTVIIMLFGSALIFSPQIYKLVFGQDAYNGNLSLVLALAGASASVFRFYQTSLFMSNATYSILLLLIGTVIAKALSIISLYFTAFRIDIFYYLQTILVVATIFVVALRNHSKMVHT